MIDPFGHRWMLSQTIEQVTPDEMQRRWDEETGVNDDEQSLRAAEEAFNDAMISNDVARIRTA